MVELRGIRKSFGNNGAHAALKPLDLRLMTGRTVALLGPSGCGKSTLLRLLMGLIVPDAGEILIDGEPMTAATALRLRRSIGYVIQDGGLFPHLSAGENVALMARYLGWPRARIDARLSELLALVRLPASLLPRFPAELSGGQRQRIGLMRALMLDPSLLLLDEPLGALDPMVRAELQADLREIFQTQTSGALPKTVVIVTHDLSEAAFLGDELILMREGAVVQRGALADLAQRPVEPFVTQFLSAQRSLSAGLGAGGATDA